MIKPLISGINSLFSLFYLVILIRCFLSFVPNIDWSKQPYFILRQITDSYLNIFRRIIPPIGMLDISPMVALIALWVIQNIIIAILIMVG